MCHRSGRETRTTTDRADCARRAQQIGETISAYTNPGQQGSKAVRETLAADIPLAIDHYHHFTAAIRTQESRTSHLDHNTVAYHFYEPIGVVGQIIP